MGSEFGKSILKLMFDRFAMAKFEVSQSAIKLSVDGKDDIKPIEIVKISNASYKITFKDGSMEPLTVNFSSSKEATFKSPGNDPILVFFKKEQ